MHSNLKNRGFVEIILVIVAVLAIAGGAALWYFTQGNFKITTDTAAPDYSSSTSADLETELNGIELDDPTADFKDIDSDLNSL